MIGVKFLFFASCAVLIQSTTFSTRGENDEQNDLKPSSARILKGYYAKKNQFPYQAALFEYKHFICGSVIYTDKIILTAAHCLWDEYNNETLKSEKILVGVGKNDLYKFKHNDLHKVKRVVIHEEFENDRNDIGFVELEKPLKFSDAVKPIELHDKSFESGTPVIISGWGETEYGSENRLKFDFLRGITQPKCGKEVGDDYKGFLCVERPISRGMCFGDSGGPAVSKGKLVGIAELVIESCENNKPNVYTYIPEYHDWIKNNIKT